MEKPARPKRSKASSPAPYHHGDLRNELIRQGRLFLDSSGTTEISLAELARRVGVSDAAPFRHFETKEALLAAIAVDGMQELVHEQTAIAALDASNVEKVRAMMLNYVDYARKSPGVFNLMIGPRIAELGPYPELQVIGSRSFQLFRDAIQALALDSGWALEEVELLAHGAWAMQHGLASLILAKRVPHRTSKVKPDEMIELAISMVLTSIAARPPGTVLTAERKPPTRRNAA